MLARPLFTPSRPGNLSGETFPAPMVAFVAQQIGVNPGALAEYVSQLVLVMLNGRIALRTTSAEITRDEALQRRYLCVSTRLH
jgi:hypothetical protein